LKKTIAILITCHNRKEKTLQCLEALFQNTIPENVTLHVFLVDDGSTDGTGIAVSDHFPEVHIVKGNGKLYWNKGMHLAWQSAITFLDFDYYLWLNDDTVLFTNAIQCMIEDAHKMENKHIICGTTQSRDLLDYTYGGKLKNGELILPNGYLQECFFINGNCVLISKNIYNAVGTLDPIYPHAIGDYEYGFRARKKGVKSFVASKAIGMCNKNASLPKWCLPHVSFYNRLKNLYSPLGSSHPYYFFIFEVKHRGIATAFLHFITIHVRLFFPKLWKHQ